MRDRINFMTFSRELISFASGMYCLFMNIFDNWILDHVGLNPSKRDAFVLVKSIFSLIHNSEGTSVSLQGFRGKKGLRRVFHRDHPFSPSLTWKTLYHYRPSKVVIKFTAAGKEDWFVTVRSTYKLLIQYLVQKYATKNNFWPQIQLKRHKIFCFGQLCNIAGFITML